MRTDGSHRRRVRRLTGDVKGTSVPERQVLIVLVELRVVREDTSSSSSCSSSSGVGTNAQRIDFAHTGATAVRHCDIQGSPQRVGAANTVMVRRAGAHAHHTRPISEIIMNSVAAVVAVVGVAGNDVDATGGRRRDANTRTCGGGGGGIGIHGVRIERTSHRL